MQGLGYEVGRSQPRGVRRLRRSAVAVQVIRVGLVKMGDWTLTLKRRRPIISVPLRSRGVRIGPSSEHGYVYSNSAVQQTRTAQDTRQLTCARAALKWAANC